jgi:hypothetical protein
VEKVSGFPYTFSSAILHLPSHKVPSPISPIHKSLVELIPDKTHVADGELAVIIDDPLDNWFHVFG